MTRSGAPTRSSSARQTRTLTRAILGRRSSGQGRASDVPAAVFQDGPNLRGHLRATRSDGVTSAGWRAAVGPGSLVGVTPWPLRLGPEGAPASSQSTVLRVGPLLSPGASEIFVNPLLTEVSTTTTASPLHNFVQELFARPRRVTGCGLGGGQRYGARAGSIAARRPFWTLESLSSGHRPRSGRPLGGSRYSRIQPSRSRR
jgi:hypothetical protein